MAKDDVILVKEYQGGRTEVFGLLYDKYIDKIYRFVYYKVQHKESAEDIVSKTFMKALENLASFKLDQGTFQAWLYRIARNQVIDFYRTKKHEENIDDYWGLSEKSDIARDLDVRNRLSEVEKYLQNLDPFKRELIMLRVWQDYSFSEIADITGRSESACKMAYSRAVHALRNDLPASSLALLLLFRYIV